MVRVSLPYHLQTLAGTAGEVTVEPTEPVTVLSVIRALERRYPMLCGAITEHGSNQRRPKIRFFACNADLSFDSLETELPAPVREGIEPLLIIGAISGG